MYRFLLIFVFSLSLVFIAKTVVSSSDAVTFHLSEMETEVICLSDVVNITGIKVSSTQNIEKLEYSLDGGSSWVALEPLDTYKEVTFNLPEVPFDVGLFVFKLRVLAGGQTYLSEERYIPTSCGEAVILGYYFEDNGESAIVTQSGDILSNPNHELEIFVETSYVVSKVDVSLGEELVNLNYDYSTKLWSGVIPEEFLSEGENNLEIIGETQGDYVKKRLPMIFNTKSYVSELQELSGGYEVHYFNGYEWKLMEYEGGVMNYPIFTLLPGKYYIKVQQNHSWFYSTIFEIEEKTIVAVSGNENVLPVFFQWLERYFSSLEVVLFDSSFYSMQKNEELYFSEFEEFLESSNRDGVLMYINRWNPWYRQTLKILEMFGSNYDIVLITDENNFSHLSSTLEVYAENVELHRIEDSLLLRKFLSYQPQIVFYNSSSKSFHVSYSLQSFVNLLNNF